MQGQPDDAEPQPSAAQYRVAFNVLLSLAAATFLIGLVGWSDLRGWPFFVVALGFAIGAVACWRASLRAPAD
jgi:hypothetical protein